MNCVGDTLSFFEIGKTRLVLGPINWGKDYWKKSELIRPISRYRSIAKMCCERRYLLIGAQEKVNPTEHGWKRVEITV